MINKKTDTYRWLMVVATMLIGLGGAQAQEVLSLEECRRRALDGSLSLKQAQAQREQTEALEKVALWQMLPKLSANGGYVWTEKSINLLSDEQKERISHLGDDIQTDISNAIHQEMSDYNVELGPISLPIGDAIAGRLDNALTNADLSGKVNAFGNEIIDGLTTDTRQMGMATVTLTQPIYMGGKLHAAYRTARLLNSLSGIKYDKQREETLIAVDEAYWQVVSVSYKKELAEKYAALLDTLEANVEMAVEAEMATKGDLAKVRVKRNEAQMSLTKATNGLVLAKMLLAERCGMPLNSDFNVQLDDDLTAAYAADHTIPTAPMDTVYKHRGEMRMLRIADSVARQGVRVAASTLKPNIAATAGYMVSNPNVFDGFRNEWGGTWMAGVVVNIPIAHPDGIYAVKAAKAKRREVGYQMDEARQMIALQVTKLTSELELAYKKLDQAMSAMQQAEENLLLADESFKAGMCNSSDLMMAQTAWVQAHSEIIDARIEIVMDRVYLKQALGQ